MRPKWQLKRDASEIAEMQALAAAYRGSIKVCPPGVARGHETKPKDAALKSQGDTQGHDAP